MFSLPRDGGVKSKDHEFKCRKLVDASKHSLGFASVRLDIQLPAKDLIRRCVGYDVFGRHASVIADNLTGAEFAACACDACFTGGVG